MSKGPSLSERAHLNIKTVRLVFSQFHAYFLFVGVTMVVISAILVVETDEELRKYGQFQYSIPDYILFPSNGTFLPFDNSKYPIGLLNHLVVYQTQMVLLLAVFGSVMMTYLAWFYLHVSKKLKNLEQWDKDYLKQAYYIVFQTTIPSGNTVGEKMLNLAKLVFPELREDYDIYASIPERLESSLLRHVLKEKPQQELISRSLNYRVKKYGKDKEYKLDLALKTRLGYFIVKHFKDTITPLEIRELIKAIKSEFGKSKVFRAILVSKAYDPIFLERTSIRDLAKKLQIDFKIDLIVEEENGYSVLWIG